MRVLCIVTAQGGVRCSTIHTVKIAVHSAKGCCAATTMALTSIKQKFSAMNITSSDIETGININGFTRGETCKTVHFEWQNYHSSLE